MKKTILCCITALLSIITLISFTACSGIAGFIEKNKDNLVQSSDEQSSNGEKSQENTSSEKNISMKSRKSQADSEESSGNTTDRMGEESSDDTIDTVVKKINDEPSRDADKNNVKFSGMPDIPDVTSIKKRKNQIAKAFLNDEKYIKHSFPTEFDVLTVKAGVKIDSTGLIGWEIFKLEDKNGTLIVMDDDKTDMDSAVKTNFITTKDSSACEEGSYFQINEPGFYLVTALYDNPNPVSDISWAPEKNSAILNVTPDNAAPTVKFEQKSDVILEIGDTFIRKATVSPAAVITYTSSDGDVATVDADGRITAKEPGEARIIASCGDKSDSYLITVNNTLKNADHAQPIIEQKMSDNPMDITYDGDESTSEASSSSKDVSITQSHTMTSDEREATRLINNIIELELETLHEILGVDLSEMDNVWKLMTLQEAAKRIGEIKGSKKAFDMLPDNFVFYGSDNFKKYYGNLMRYLSMLQDIRTTIISTDPRNDNADKLLKNAMDRLDELELFYSNSMQIN